MTIRPAVSADNLVMYEFRRRFIEGAIASPAFATLHLTTGSQEEFEAALEDFVTTTRPLFESLVVAPDLVGDVPPIFWLDKDLHRQLSLMVFNLAFDWDGLIAIDDDEDPVYAPIDLHEEGTLILRGARRSRSDALTVYRRETEEGPRLEIQHWHAAKPANSHSDKQNLIVRLIEVLALRINAPDLHCEVTTSMPPQVVEPKKLSKRVEFFSTNNGSLKPNLNPQVTLKATPESLPAELARRQLASLVSLYRQGLAEPLPLFRKTSAAAALGSNSEKCWESDDYSRDERSDLENMLLFPMSYDELVSETQFNDIVEVLRQAMNGVELTSASRSDRNDPKNPPSPLKARMTNEGV